MIGTAIILVTLAALVIVADTSHWDWTGLNNSHKRARTLAALHILNTVRKAIVLRFLNDSDLLQYVKGFLYSLDLSNTDLSQIDLSGANLINANLSGTNLYSTDLRDASLDDADLSY